MSETVSHYEMLEKLGEGGIGVVYRARDTRLQRYVALKFLPPHIGADDVERERFLQEARAASALDHPNICTIHDIEQAPDGRTFIVMACYEGETLRARIRRGPLPVKDALAIGRQIATGLARAHERGIVHRDVKPANIFLTADGPVKVLDFGIVRLVAETHLQVTHAGTTVGAVAYMSPEQARGEPVDRRADIWAIGVILYEMLTGRPPFDGQQDSVLLQAIQTRDPEPLGRLRPETPRALAELIERMLKKRPDDRLVNARDVADALASIETSVSAGDLAPAGGILRRPLVAISLALAICVLAVVAGWLWFTSNRASWARNQALPAIGAMAAEERFSEAVALATQAERYLPGDPALAKLWSDISVLATIDSNPEGALVEVRPHADRTGSWHALGTTPLHNVRVARGTQRFRFTRAQSETIEREVMVSVANIRVELPPAR
jgi:hypothetical protein